MTHDVREAPILALARGDEDLARVTAARRERLVDGATEIGRHAVIVYSAAAHSLLSTDGVWWTTGFKPMGECAVAIGPDGVFELFVSPTWDEARASEIVGDRARGVDDVLLALANWREVAGVAKEEILFCGGDSLPSRRYARAAETLGTVDGSGTRILLETSRRHDEYEIALATRAAAMAELAFDRLVDQLTPGQGEFAAVTLLDSLLRELGSEDNFVLVSASQLNRSVHPPTERIIERGDVLLAEISPSVGGVFTQICRTASIGAPSLRLREDFETLDRAFEAGLGACVPGLPVRGAALAMDEVLTDAGFGEYCQPPFMRARGHGLGIGSVLPGDINKSSQFTFCEGDYFVLHPNQFLPTSGYMLCGEPVVLGSVGARELSARRGVLAVVDVTS
jgi:Xaa-Pro aminopeptidase